MSTSSRPGDRARDVTPTGTGTGTHAKDEVQDPYGFPRGVPSIGGYYPRSWPSALLPGRRRAGLPIQPRLAALNRDYPAWRITWFRCSDGSPGGWWAMRRAPLTTADRAAGLVACIARGDLVSLMSEVTVQDDIAAELANASAAEPPAGDRRLAASRIAVVPRRTSRTRNEQVEDERGRAVERE